MACSASSDVNPSELMLLKVQQALRELSLEPLDSECERKIEMHFANTIERFLCPYCSAFKRQDVPRLGLVADCLDFAAHHLAILTQSPAVATHLLKRLAQERAIGSPVSASLFLEDSNEKLCTLSRALREVETVHRRVTDKRRQRRYAWYDTFVLGVLFICELNGIKPSISTDRSDWKRGGRFLEIAERLEGALPTDMRSPSRQALAQRLRRSRGRIKKRSISAEQIASTTYGNLFLLALDLQLAGNR
jgi:hypothetical protein